MESYITSYFKQGGNSNEVNLLNPNFEVNNSYTNQEGVVKEHAVSMSQERMQLHLNEQQISQQRVADFLEDVKEVAENYMDRVESKCMKIIKLTPQQSNWDYWNRRYNINIQVDLMVY